MPRGELLKAPPAERLSPEELRRVFLQDVYALPEGERIDLCIQCGTCSASCPTASYMEYSPREIIAALRAGLLDRVLHANTHWMCTSCYTCTVRCPQKIKITDLMYELKRLGIKYGYTDKHARAAAMAHIFIDLTNKRGRNHETELMMRYYMTRPAAAMANAARGLKMFSQGRLPLPGTGKSIKGLKELRKIREALERIEAEKLAKEAGK
jgi:quinone-modifying oxidoreductase subunit QmoC